jgi:cell wall-associated NlpC family hydrolase
MLCGQVFVFIHFVKIFLVLCVIIITSCTQKQDENIYANDLKDTSSAKAAQLTYDETQQIETGNIKPQELLSFAQTLIGTPYKYASTDPASGFDCSGFITYIFNHFNIAVPRSSVGFTNVQRQIDIEEAKPGDIILFTGTDSAIRTVGHMGIIISRNDTDLQFIHSSSGKANGVTITPFNKYYAGRFVKVIRIFKQNDLD